MLVPRQFTMGRTPMIVDSGTNITFRYMRFPHALILATVLILTNSCPHTGQEPELSGVWDSNGYGKQMIVADSTVTLYDTFSGGCTLFAELARKNFEERAEILHFTTDSLELKTGLTVYEFIRTDPDIPACTEQLAEDNPLSNFDALWNTFNENYSSFDLRDVEWDTLRAHYRPMLTKQSSASELYSVLNRMVSELNDGHVFIEAPDSVQNNRDTSSGIGIAALRDTVISKINGRYLDEPKHYNKGHITWGTIDGNTGYIQINNFEDLADYQISDSLSQEAFWEAYWEAAGESRDYTKDALEGLNNQMEVIMKDLQSTAFCIIDVRFNSGGFDQAGLNVLRFFTNQRTFAYTKKARDDNGFTGKQKVYIDTTPAHYENQLFILTSHQTASASETFVLASMNLPGLARIGSTTAGVFSDVLLKRLPNGWQYGLSNEVYESPGGVSYEMIGIPPDYTIDYAKDGGAFYRNVTANIDTGDRALQKAIELGKKQ